MSIQELAEMLDNSEIYFWESGAYYDTPMDTFMASEHERIEVIYNLSIIG